MLWRNPLLSFVVISSKSIAQSYKLAVERYATALLVRLRRLLRNGPGGADPDDDDLDELETGDDDEI